MPIPTVSPTDLGLLPGFLAAHPIPSLMAGAGAGFWLLTRPKSRQAGLQPRGDVADVVSRPDNNAWLRRQWWRIRPPHDLMRVDGLQIDRSRKPHCAWLGPTGAGKSSAVAVVRLNGQRPMLVATPDISDPLLAAGSRLPKYFHWRACEGPRAIDFLQGSPTELAERLTEVFRSGGVGAWKRTARMATARVIRDIDADGLPRSLQVIGERLEQATSRERDLKMVCAGWVARFCDMADQFGASIAADGVDLAHLLNDGYTVILDNDAFAHPGLVEDVISLALSEAKRCTTLVHGGFRLVFEEAGQLNDRIELAAPFFRAGRRRKIAVDVLTQAETDLEYHGSDAITANLGTRFYFAQELKPLQRSAADRLGIDYRELDPARMRDFTAYVSHGRIRRLVRFPKPPRGQEPAVRPSQTSSGGEVPTVGSSGGHRVLVREMPVVRRVLPMLPAPREMPPAWWVGDDPVRLRVWRKLRPSREPGLLWHPERGFWRDGPCLEWQNAARGGRPAFKLGKRTMTTYIETYKWSGRGIPPSWEIDHLCANPLCCEPGHLEAVTTEENIRRRDLRKRALLG